MTLTLRAVLDELDRLQGERRERTIDEIGRDEIVQSVARAALLGARGNSGVILSQLIRGAAEELVSRPGQLIDPTLIGAALANAADRAYSSVRDPAEGTILTVAREMAHQIATDVAHSPENPRLEPDDRARGAGQGDRSGARARGPRRPGHRQARPGTARAAAGSGGRRRRRLWPDDHVRGRRRGAAGRGRARARASRARPHHPPPAQLEHLPLLHQLRRHRHGAQRRTLHRAARGARRLGAGRRGHQHAEGPPAHRPPGARHGRVRGRRGGLAPGRRRHARAGRRARGAPGGRGRRARQRTGGRERRGAAPEPRR